MRLKLMLSLEVWLKQDPCAKWLIKMKRFKQKIYKELMAK